MNPFARAARSDKAQALVTGLEVLAELAGADLSDWRTYRRLAEHAYYRMSAADWIALAREAGTRKPSQETVQVVVDKLVATGVARAYAAAHQPARGLEAVA